MCDPDVSGRSEHRKFYRTIKRLPPSRDDFLSDEATGSLPPRNPHKVRYWRGFSVFDTLEQARAIAQRSRSQGDFTAEMMVPVNGAIAYERWRKNPGHHALWGDPDECLARVTNVFPVFPAAGSQPMTTHFELWNDRTNNLIDEFDTMEQALDEVRWRVSERGDDAGRTLSLLRLDAAGAVEAIASGDELARRSREMTIVGD